MASGTSSYEVHLGFWTNWAHGRLQGATVTLTQRNGGFLIAFLAIFVGMVGKSFWRLACFMLHRYFSSSDPQDGLYHQRQAILRNSDTAQDGAWRLFVSLLAWRSGARARRPIARLLPIILAALLLSSTFGIASIFSSQVTNEKANEVLLTGTRCGQISQNKANNMTKSLELLLPYYAERASQVLTYGLQCYTNASNEDGCNVYVKPQLPMYANTAADCPFPDPKLCKSSSSNLVLDTGLLDSVKHFGINSSPQEQFQFRIVQHCAPMTTDNYTETWTDPDLGPMMRYMYGQGGTVKHTRWSYEVRMNRTDPPDDGSAASGTSRPEYALGTLNAYGPPNSPTFTQGTNSFKPISSLSRNDSDITLILISAPGIRFSAPVSDPWLSAHKLASSLFEKDTNQTFNSYVQDEPAGIFGCAIQYQYCNPGTSACEPLRGLIDPAKKTSLMKVFPEKRQRDAVAWADDLIVANIFNMDNLVGFIGASALRARYGLSYGFQGPLPSNQWILEVEHFLKGTLASIQDVFVTIANGIPMHLEDFRLAPDKNNTVARSMCKNQKILSQKYSSFNVLGVSLILVLGSWIIVLDIGLEPAVAWWQRRRFRKEQLKDQFFDPEGKHHPLYAAVEWSHTSTLQLQRLAHEEVGFGVWERGDGDCPVTGKDQKLASLDLKDVGHPVLRREESTKAGGAGEWDDVMRGKEWGIRRTDTGLETLVEEIQTEGKGKGGDEEMDVIVTVVGARERDRSRS
ncbi:hypothetical protein BCR34DRAFT_31387 [Clohesyomyces aquaticus]|uniref:Uncharacterized protein n=1 Tax=Clohesyomyces aquaticus TaxID=1231657 RepID=A0A1Y1ZAD6_9PLEO|nr:hypothetical protein BCR34DRAFT_31387 [Clohesyomyces aquaticus]